MLEIMICITVIFILVLYVCHKVMDYKFEKAQKLKEEQKRLDEQKKHEEMIARTKIDHSFTGDVIKVKNNTISVPKRKLPTWHF